MKKPRVQEPSGVSTSWETRHCWGWEFRAMKMKVEGEMEVRGLWVESNENFGCDERREWRRRRGFVFSFILRSVGGRDTWTGRINLGKRGGVRKWGLKCALWIEVFQFCENSRLWRLLKLASIYLWTHHIFTCVGIGTTYKAKLLLTPILHS